MMLFGFKERSHHFSATRCPAGVAIHRSRWHYSNNNNNNNNNIINDNYIVNINGAQNGHRFRAPTQERPPATLPTLRVRPGVGRRGEPSPVVCRHSCRPSAREGGVRSLPSPRLVWALGPSRAPRPFTRKRKPFSYVSHENTLNYRQIGSASLKKLTRLRAAQVIRVAVRSHGPGLSWMTHAAARTGDLSPEIWSDLGHRRAGRWQRRIPCAGRGLPPRLLVCLAAKGGVHTRKAVCELLFTNLK